MCIPCWPANDYGRDLLSSRKIKGEKTEHLEALDAEFTLYPHNLTDLLFAYVAGHPDDFGTLPTPE